MSKHMYYTVAMIMLAVAVVTSSTLPFNPSNDPKANLDSLSELSESELRADWSSDSGTLKDMIEHLKSFEMLVSIDVKLVGWEDTTDESYASHLSENDFFKYFEALQNQHNINAVHPQDGNHELKVKSRFMYQVVQADHSLSTKLEKAVVSSLDKDGFLIPYSVVDDIISEDYKENTLSYTIYLMNLRKYGGELGERVYYYVDPETKGHSQPCGFQVWAGKGRYMWIDLSAGPVTYGPRTSGDGVVTRYTLPRVEDHKHPEALVASLVSTVRSTSEYLISPSLTYFPMPYVESISVHVIVITDMMQEGQDESSFKTNLDWKTIKERVEMLGLKGQDISVGMSVMSFLECELCAAAYTHALKSHTSNILSAGLKTQVHQYLDSKVLHSWLKRFGSEHWGLDLMSDDMRILPVFVFELSTESILLLDRFHQAVAFPEFVVAVQTQGERAVVDYQCMDSPVSFHTNDATRAVLAAILETGFAVSPPYSTWSPVHNSTVENYLWAVGHTPFAYFSDSKELSFSVVDAARRNGLYTLVSNAINEVHGFIDSFKRFNVELDEILSYSAHAQFVRRWNVFRWKLDTASQFLTVHNYNHALYYLKSMRVDIRALHELIRLAGDHLNTNVTCRKERVHQSSMSIFSVLFWVVVISTPATLLYMSFVKKTHRAKHRML